MIEDSALVRRHTRGGADAVHMIYIDYNSYFRCTISFLCLKYELYTFHRISAVSTSRNRCKLILDAITSFASGNATIVDEKCLFRQDALFVLYDFH